MNDTTIQTNFHKTHLRVFLLLFIAALCLISADSAMGQVNQSKKSKKLKINGKEIRHIERTSEPAESSAPCPRLPNRSVDGTCNNITNTATTIWGAADVELARDMPAGYGLPDFFNDMAGNCRISPRAISNLVVAQSEDLPSPRGLSSLVFTWGQFIDHDIDLTPEGHTEYIPVLLPANESLFTQPIPFLRSEPASDTGISDNREQQNIISSWMDASQVYGSEITRSNWLRTFSQGKLKTSEDNLLPYNTLNGLASGTLDVNAPSMAGDGGGTILVFVAGDVRANEQPGLTAMHTLFVREHNRICDQLTNQGMNSDELIYQRARKIVGGYIQSITYRAFLPALGVQLPPYSGYNSSVHPDITNMFATAAYRLGHTMVTNEIPLVDNNCNPVGSGSIPLLEGFFNNAAIVEYGIAPLLQGLAGQTQQKVDTRIIDNLRNFLFPVAGSPDPFGLDLASLNIQRGRDHGLPDYNSVRAFYTNHPVSEFSDITSDSDLQAALETAYGNVYNMDLWVGLLAEDVTNNSSVGITLQAILGKQFAELRDGDYYFYQNDPAFSAFQKDQISRTTLRDILKRNTSIQSLQDNIFFANDCQVNGGGGNGGGSGGGGNGGSGGGGGGSGGSGSGGNPIGGGNLNEANLGGFLGQNAVMEFTVFPNPSKGKINVNVLLEEVPDKIYVTVTNVDGRQVYEETAFLNGKRLNTRIDLEGNPPGVYLVSIQTGMEFLSRKVVME